MSETTNVQHTLATINESIEVLNFSVLQEFFIFSTLTTVTVTRAGAWEHRNKDSISTSERFLVSFEPTRDTYKSHLTS